MLILTMALVHVYVHDMNPQFWEFIIPTYGLWFENFHNTCCNPWKEDPTPHFNQSHLTQPSNVLMVRIELPIWFSIILLITTCVLNLQMDNAIPIWVIILQELSTALKRVQFGKGFFLPKLAMRLQFPKWEFIWECWDLLSHICEIVFWTSRHFFGLFPLSCFNLGCST